MINTIDSYEILAKEYHIDNYMVTVDNLLPDFVVDKAKIAFDSDIFDSVVQLGASAACQLVVYEIMLKQGVQNRRTQLTQAAFRMLSQQATSNAIIAFVDYGQRNYRISLLTSKYEWADNDKAIKKLSNPRRYSYALGYDTKTKTAYKFLIQQGKVQTLDALMGRFSVEVVNREFYNGVVACFDLLVDSQLALGEVVDSTKKAEFGVRLIGRIMFCWFLKHKKSESGLSLIPDSLLSRAGVQDNADYYHTILEKLFFEILNKPIERRQERLTEGFYRQIPYLNGGIFDAHQDDGYNMTNKQSTVSITDEWFCKLYDLLGDYNFTVDESTSYDIELSIDPEMLGRIFENLLAEINPDTGASARKSTGSFYTPREIVDYMVDNCIVHYLRDCTGIAHTILTDLVGLSGIDNTSDADRDKLVHALYNMTILDPACGSGAFSIGCLQKIVHIFKKVDPDCKKWLQQATQGISSIVRKEIENSFGEDAKDYLLKHSIIQRSIFGVDIQPIAVEISRLRCFLSLIIENKVDDGKPNRGITPLPNLDFKFVVANTLMPLKQQNQNSMLIDNNHIDKLRNIREEYFGASPNRRAELKYEFVQVQKGMLEYSKSLNDTRDSDTDMYSQLYSWNPFESDCTRWFDPKWMFGVQDGFDIVIANPPYVHLEKLPEQHKKQFFAQPLSKSKHAKPTPLYATYNARGDLYGLFYERGAMLLKKGGHLVYITSNKWLKAGYGAILRDWMLDNTTPLQLVDLGAGRFESATVDTNILVLCKQANSTNTPCQAISYAQPTLKNMAQEVNQNSIPTIFKKGQNWTILSPIEQSIKNKLERIGTPLRDWDIKINRGIMTGCNEAFIIDQQTRDTILANCTTEAEKTKTNHLIRPVLRGRDIKKNNYKWAGLYMINTHDGYVDRQGIMIPRVDIDIYPSVKKHLDNFIDILSNRTDKGQTPYNLRSCAYTDDFAKHKIVYSEIVQSPQFYLDSDNFFVDASGYIMVGKYMDYLVQWLNSPTIAWCFKRYYTVNLGTGGFRYQKAFVHKLPIPLPTDCNAIYDEYRIQQVLGLTQEEIATMLC